MTPEILHSFQLDFAPLTTTPVFSPPQSPLPDHISRASLWGPYEFLTSLQIVGKSTYHWLYCTLDPIESRKIIFRREDSKDIRRDELQILEESLRFILLAGKKKNYVRSLTKTPIVL